MLGCADLKMQRALVLQEVLAAVIRPAQPTPYRTRGRPACPASPTARCASARALPAHMAARCAAPAVAGPCVGRPDPARRLLSARPSARPHLSRSRAPLRTLASTVGGDVQVTNFQVRQRGPAAAPGWAAAAAAALAVPPGFALGRGCTNLTRRHSRCHPRASHPSRRMWCRYR